MFQPLLDMLRPGAVVYVQGASGESQALCSALARNRHRCRGVHFVSCLLPGMNRFDYAGLDETMQLTVFLISPVLQKSFAEGRVRVLPMSYLGVAAYLPSLLYDVAVFHVSPPDSSGRSSFGIAADFGPLVWPCAKKRIVLVNRAMPFLAHGPRVDLSEADAVIEIDDPLLEAPPSETRAAVADITRCVAALVPDGATMQTGIGGVPGATLAALSEKRDIKIHTGIVNDGLMTLACNGALAKDHVHKAGIAYGSRSFYDFLEMDSAVAFAPVSETHDLAALSNIEHFIAVNSALEVDFFGQANLEWKNGALVSGVGGAPDFARGALASSGGKSIIALPATTGAGASRIAPRLSAPTVSLSRDLADIVVTEYGAAHIRNFSPNERAEALIAIAAPAHRAGLEEAWRAQERGL